MQDKIAKHPQFSQTLRFHSYARTIFTPAQTPIYQFTQTPYDFYLYLQFQVEPRTLQIYQQMATMGKPMIEITHSEVLPVQCSFWSSLVGKKQTNPATGLYMKYYNFSLKDWIQSRKSNGLRISQAELIYLLKTLLPIAVAFRIKYHHPTSVFHSKYIFLTHTRRLALYPILFKVTPQHQEMLETHRDLGKDESSKLTARKQESMGSNSSESTLQSSRVYQHKNYGFLDLDLQDIFLLVLELLTSKPREYFFSAKHGMIKWDLAQQSLKSEEYVGHLSKDFVTVWQQLLKRRIQSCEALLRRIEDISQKQQEVVCLGKVSEKTSTQYPKEEDVKQRQEKVSKTFSKGEIIPIKKQHSVQ